MSPYCYEIGTKTLITIFKILQPLNSDLKEIIIDKIFYSLIMEDFIHDYETISLNDDNWEYDIEGHFDNY